MMAIPVIARKILFGTLSAVAPIAAAVLCGLAAAPVHGQDAADLVLNAEGPLHKGGVSALAVSPDGARLISGGWDKSLILWDLTATPPKPQPMTGAQQSTRRVGFSPDGAIAYVTGDAGTVSRWDVATGTQIGTPWPAHLAVSHDIEVTQDGDTLMTASRDGTLLVLDAHTGRQIIRHIIIPRANALAKRVPLPKPGDDQRFRAGELASMQHWIRDIAVSANGARAVIVGNDRLLRVWDVVEGRPLFEPIDAHAESITGVALTPNGRFAVTSSVDRTIKTWRISDGRAIGPPLQGHKAAIYALAMHPTELQVLAIDMAGEVLLWDVPSGQVLRRLSVRSAGGYAVAFSPDGCFAFAAGTTPAIHLWRLCDEG